MIFLKEILARAAREHWALGHFNFSELDQARAILVINCRPIFVDRPYSSR